MSFMPEMQITKRIWSNQNLDISVVLCGYFENRENQMLTGMYKQCTMTRHIEIQMFFILKHKVLGLLLSSLFPLLERQIEFYLFLNWSPKCWSKLRAPEGVKLRQQTHSLWWHPDKLDVLHKLPQNAKQENKAFHSLFHGKQRIGGMQRIAFNLFVCFGSVLIKVFTKLLPCPAHVKVSRLPFASFLFPFIYLICEKNQRGSATSHCLGELVSLQSCRCRAERTQTGSGEARRVLSIIQHVKREEGTRKRGRVKAGSRLGGKSLGWIGGISFPPVAEGRFFGHLPRHMPS